MEISKNLYKVDILATHGHEYGWEPFNVNSRIYDDSDENNLMSFVEMKFAAVSRDEGEVDFEFSVFANSSVEAEEQAKQTLTCIRKQVNLYPDLKYLDDAPSDIVHIYWKVPNNFYEVTLLIDFDIEKQEYEIKKESVEYLDARFDSRFSETVECRSIPEGSKKLFHFFSSGDNYMKALANAQLGIEFIVKNYRKYPDFHIWELPSSIPADDEFSARYKWMTAVKVAPEKMDVASAGAA